MHVGPPSVTRNRFLFGVFAVAFLLLTILLLNRARAFDAASGGTVPTTGDDWNYQTLAVNLLYGLGYRNDYILPLETYHLDLTTPKGVELRNRYADQGSIHYDADANFYRAPGYPLLLSLSYRVSGNSTRNARYGTVILIFGVAILLTLMGGIWAGWRGILAAGTIGLLYMFPSFMRGSDLNRLLTEVPTTFWITLFAFFFVLHQKTRRSGYLLLAAVALACAIFTRAVLFIAFPPLILFCLATKVRLRLIALFSTLIILPIVVWSLYASTTAHKVIVFTTQGEIAFPQFNNVDVLDGVGPQHLYQGGWNPGRVLNADGTWISDYHNAAQPGENGWLKGLAFWRDNFLQLPRLFFLKLRASFWTDTSLAPLFAGGIAVLLLTLGLRQPQPGNRLAVSRMVLRVQLALALAVLVTTYIFGTSQYLLTLCIYGLILLLALIHPYGDVVHMSLPSPLWFLAFLFSHLVTTLLFGDPRFHEPLDPLLGMYGLFGLLVIVESAISPPKRRELVLSLQG